MAFLGYDIKRKTYKMNSDKIKKFCESKDTINRMKSHSTKSRKIFAYHSSEVN
jgi:hypothetical protein